MTATLRGSYSRPLGFHLAPDRTYLKRSFQQNQIFQYSQYTSRDYIWSYAFQDSAAQYEDMFRFLVTWRFHFTRRLGTYYLQKEAGTLEPANQSVPVDEYGFILSRVFPGYQFVDKEDTPTDLFVRIPSGEIISFADLSSGEKEVFFTLCFFQRHNVEQAVILIDEPEMHLHPSLCRVLVRTMMDVKKNNQIWLATQSAEVIDEAGRDRVYYIRRRGTEKAEIIPATEEDESLACLRDFFGYSGYIGLARAMVFTEGRNASTDRKMFSRLVLQLEREIKFIPANGCSESERINRAVLALLESNIAWCKFFLIRDRDFLTDSMVENIKQRSKDKVFILEKHEIENYLIVFEVMAKVITEIYDKSMSDTQIESELLLCAKDMAGNVLRDMVAFRLNMIFRPEDFSIPKLGQGKSIIGADSKWIVGDLEQLRDNMSTRYKEVVSDVQAAQSKDFNTVFDECKQEIETSLECGSWMSLFPGKELIQQLCAKLGLGKPPVLQNSIIKELAAHPEQIAIDLRDILSKISNS